MKESNRGSGSVAKGVGSVAKGVGSVFGYSERRMKEEIGEGERITHNHNNRW